MQNFRNLEIWKKSFQLSVDTYRLTEKFPSSEKFGIISQMNRAVVSMSSNIAEGASRSSAKEFGRYLELALGSAFELETQLLISKELNYGNKPELERILNELTSIQKMIHSFHQKVTRATKNQ